MPYISEIQLSARHGSRDAPVDARITAVVRFSDVEQRLELEYWASAVLYEIDGQMDVYSVHPNSRAMFVQHAYRSNNSQKDDHLGFSRAQRIKADAAQKQLEFQIVDNRQRWMEGGEDMQLELRALVAVVPDTSTAVRWSNTEKVYRVVG